MASGDQIKALLRAFREQDQEQVLSLALQIAANEAKAGHGKLAADLRSFVNEVKASTGFVKPVQPIAINQPRGELADLVSVAYPHIRLIDLVMSRDLRQQLEKVLREQRESARIREIGLIPRHKLMLVGPPGTGKTLSASALAGELRLPLFTVRLDGLFTRYMGETAVKLNLIFESIAQVRGVYLFDEFDALGSQRGMQNDVGEIRRVLNSFLQLIEKEKSQSLLIAATNHPQILDEALFRRFDDIIHYELPSPELAVELIKSKLSIFIKHDFNWDEIANKVKGLSYADLTRISEDTIKDAIIHFQKDLMTSDVLTAIQERKDAKKAFNK